MGKKRNHERNDDPPEFATENEKKKTRCANYGQQSTETLLIKEQEVTKELVDLQTELSHIRSASTVSYGNNELRQMNTKRYRAEYALGEIKAEIERRARKKMGVSIPKEGIQGGSTAGVAATTTTNTAHQKTREVNAACSSIMASTVGQGQQQQRHGGGGVLKDQTAVLQGGGGVLKDSPGVMPGHSASGPSQPSWQGSGPSQPAMPHNFHGGNGQPAMPHNFFAAPPQMGVNFHGGSALNAMAMMGAMGGAPAMAGPTPEEMAQASMQFQRMQQAFMSGGMQQAGQGFPTSNAPAAFAQAPSVAAPSSNVPAAFRRRAAM